MFSYKKTTLLVFVLTLALVAEVTKADFTIGEPVNLGPSVNSSAADHNPSISADGLELYFSSYRPGGSGDTDLWVTTRATTDDPWGEPANLGPTINSSGNDGGPSISPDGCTLVFNSSRSGGYGNLDIWVTRRATRSDDWGPPVNLGPPVNSSAQEMAPNISYDGLHLFFSDYTGGLRSGGFGRTDLWTSSRQTVTDPWEIPVNLGSTVNSSVHDLTPSISADGLMLFIMSNRSGGLGNMDIWVSTRTTKDDPWTVPVNLGAKVNSSSRDAGPDISADGRTLFFHSDRSGGFGILDIWQVSIDPIVDLNDDGIVDSLDMCIIIDNWGTDEPLCDIGPMPWGDGIVDVQDLIVLAEHLFEEVPPVE